VAGDAINVITPPKMVLNATGINTKEGDLLCLKAVWMAMGIIKPKAPTLFINEDNIKPMIINALIWSMMLFERNSNPLDRGLRMPEFEIALVIIIMQPTVTTTKLLNPENASENGTTPSNTEAMSARKATISYRQNPHRNNTMVTNKIPNRRYG